MKILVTGDREWDDIKAVLHTLEQFPKGTILVHGACRGADNTCAAVAETLGFVIRAYPADWDRFHKGAGPIRNQQMLDCEHLLDEPIDMCLAFHNNFSQSRGTRDMIIRVEKAKIPWRLVTSQDHTPVAQRN